MGSLKINFCTKLSSFEDRKAAWDNAIDTAEKHVKLGQTLQSQGVKVLKSIEEGSDPEKAAKLIQQATATIDKGVKLEREARDKLIMLCQRQPAESKIK